ncbi:MAG: hypothetical protein A2622_10830 [Bdellovibrionales bacterium RIFCSPHIGHO2_01_FULL_40_29]|nr:MAG: hypothetical protein A2622_10830 [Bdellovibrionales bacterium RIFCSPHIGHO2_01_FULL_40_29]OFZ34450.1 MAG: hypothetical protein A3D17_01095 [Bdellovibrionales bacterium RIFCSPHIGHO2_02_FULL_40_15]
MYAIIDLARLNPESLAIANRAYEMWHSRFVSILDEAGEKLTPDYFYRSKYISVLYDDTKVIAMCLHNVLDLQAKGVSELSYLDPVNQILKAQLKKRSERILTVEWVAVHPDSVRQKCADIIMGLAFSFLSDSECTAAMGFSRTDYKADKVAEKFGTQKLDLIIRHGIECGVMLLKKENLKPHPDKSIQETIDDLYGERLDFTYTGLTSQNTRRLAA